MKGSKGESELSEAKKAIKALGGEAVDIMSIKIPILDRLHTLIIIKKDIHSPNEYPRQFSKISKNPL